MSKLKFIAASLFFVCTLGVYAQESSIEGKKPFRFMVRGGVGAVCSESFYDGSVCGIGTNLAGYVEMPMSKKNDNWKISLGLKLNNKNWNDSNFDANVLFLDVPVLFSYDFNIRKQTDLRLSFGLYYERYMGGKVYDNDIVNGMRASASAEDIARPHNNAGLTLGLGFLFKDFYFGADLDTNYGYEGVVFVTSATVGYRF